MPAIDDVQHELLGPIVTQWVARKNAAMRAKERFNMIARLCRQFYGSSAKAMWEDAFKKEFYPTLETPIFQISLNKAFELVAIIGPTLYWKNPERQVQSYKAPDQAQILQIMGVNDEEALKAIQQEQMMQEAHKNLRNSLATLVLDYTQNEQPTNLKKEVEFGIDEYLMTGLGLMWTETYENPGSGLVYTRNVAGSPDDLLIDPDARKPDWSDAKWIMRLHREPVWVVERRFGYPAGYLSGRGTVASSEYLATEQQSGSDQRYYDMMDWMEIWCTGGIGARVNGVDASKAEFLDRAVGDFCYLCITPNVPHPLNIPPAIMTQGSVEDLQHAVRWRTSNFGRIHELWKDNRWPVEGLWTYAVQGSPWPLAVLAPGLGHLIAMNIIMISKLTQAWDRRRDIIGVAQEMQDSLTMALRGDAHPAIIPVSEVSGKPISELIQRLERGDSADDLLDWMQYLSQEFAKATGLLDIHYGETRTQARVTGDIDAKNKAAAVRPEKMRSDVRQWVMRFSTSELWLCAQHIEGKQLEPLLGPYGAQFWDNHVRTLPFEQLVREMTCYIDAKDIERPDHARDLDALMNLSQPFMQVALPYAQATGDSNPLNDFLKKWMDAMDVRESESLQFGSFAPPPDPQAAAMQQQMQQLEAQRIAAQTDETRAKAVSRMADIQYQMNGVTPQMLQKMRQDQVLHQQELQQRMDQHLQDLMHNEEMFKQTLEQAKAQRRAQGAQK
jgi:hypothetical protein